MRHLYDEDKAPALISLQSMSERQLGKILCRTLGETMARVSELMTACSLVMAYISECAIYTTAINEK